MINRASEEQVSDFIKANDMSPVVSGTVLDLKKGGGIYHLANGMIFKLYVDECRMLPEGYPKWAHQ